jgi:hypothetical protein
MMSLGFNPLYIQCHASAGIHPTESERLSKPLVFADGRLSLAGFTSLAHPPRSTTLEDSSMTFLTVGKVRIERNGSVEGKDGLCNH